MKIAFYSAQTLEHGGGLEKYYLETASELTVRYEDVSSDIVTNGGNFARILAIILGLYYGGISKEVESHANILDRLSGDVRYIKARTFTELRRVLSQYDVIYSKNEVLELGILWLLGIKNLPPIVIGCHTPLEYPNPASIRSRIKNHLYGGSVYKALCTRVSAVHVLNATDRMHAERISNAVYMIPNPFDASKFRSLSEINAPQAINLDHLKFNIAWVGRLAEYKGVKELLSIIEAYNSQRETGFRVSWHIFGDGDYRQEVISAASDNRDLHFHGFIPYERLAATLRQCDLLISTSRAESMGYNILEAVSLGLPVIAFDIPGPKDIVIEGVNGFLVKSIDSFLERIEFFVRGDTLPNLGGGMDRFIPERIYDDIMSVLKDTASSRK